MLLTSQKHRDLANALHQNAPNLPMKLRAQAHKYAGVPLALARAQQRNPKKYAPKSTSQT